MSLRFVFGRAGTGKSTYCLAEIIRKIKEDPFGLPLILLVPEQATHQMEMQLARTPGLGGILRAQVLSFRRLGWRIFSETGGGQKPVLGETGKRMILRRLLLQLKPQLRIFARSATRPGMADILAQIIGEFKMYRITPNDLRNIDDPDPTLTQKLHELALLYDEFNRSLGHDFLDPDDELTLIAEKIPFAPSLQQATVWIDGFKGFTPQELYVLEFLLKTADEVILTLPLDPALIHRNPRNEESLGPGEEVFWGPWQTYQSLQRLTHATGTPVLPPVFLEVPFRFQTQELRFLESEYFTYPTRKYSGEKENSLHLLSAVNRRAEVEGVARIVRRLAREKGLRWREMAVLTRDLAAYQDILEQVFTAYDIPYFLDRKRHILHHPLIELLLSALDIVRTDWAYEPLFRALKTGFFPVSPDALDRLENYCLAHGIRGEAWSSGREWHYRLRWVAGDQAQIAQKERELEARINETRQTVFSYLQPFAQIVQQADITVHTVTEALYHLLVNLKVPDTLRRWTEEARARGNLAEAHLQTQIWDAVLAVMDEMVIGLGQETLDLQDYGLILASGLENLKLGLIPPGLDQLLVGSLDRSRNPEVKVLFLLGANEGTLPARPSPDGVFDREEREHLEQLGLNLAPKGKAQLYEEQFFIYTALTRATDHLYVSYPLTDEEGKGLTISPVITRLRTLFPELKDRYLGNMDMENDLELISHPLPLFPLYANRLLQRRQGKSLSPMWKAVQTWYKNHPQYEGLLKLVEGGATAVNQEEKLPKLLVRKLYGKRLMASVSRLEDFARCPFAHYAKYGLKLKERPVYQLASPDMGQFFHAILRDFAQVLRDRQLNWGALTKEESWNLVSELAETIAPNLQNEILLSNARYRYLKHKLKRTVHHAVRVLGEHARLGIFVPVQLEVQFGPGKLLPGVEIPLEEGNTLILRGQIDRVDAALIDRQIYVRILDYKSRQAQVSLHHIYYGLDLQLLAYLEAALQGAEVLLNGLEAILHPENSDSSAIAAAGFLYFPVIEPQLESKTFLTPEELETKRLKAVKVKGYLLANRQVLEAMDRSLAGGQSDLLGVKITKSQEFTKTSNVLTDEQFSQLREFLRVHLKRSGEAIMQGNIAISPYRQGKENACRYCEYKPICHFDPILPENQYRNLPPLKDEEIWGRLDSAEISSAVSASVQSSTLSSSASIPVSPSRSSPSKSSELVWLGEEGTAPETELETPPKKEGENA